MINEAIILAGGLGTRLRPAVTDVPKCMAPVAGKPFIAYLIDYYQQQGINRFIFSLGYMHEVIVSFLHEQFPSLDYSCYIEESPLGTGGAILHSLSLARSSRLLILNGDTFFAVDVKAFAAFHESRNADFSLCLKRMYGSDRYGIVETAADGRIISFKEKKWYAESLINGGVYAFNKTEFNENHFPEKFSFEKEYLEAYHSSRKFYGMIQEGYFIDIGIPEDFNKAQQDFAGNIPGDSRK